MVAAVSFPQACSMRNACSGLLQDFSVSAQWGPWRRNCKWMWISCLSTPRRGSKYSRQHTLGLYQFADKFAEFCCVQQHPSQISKSSWPISLCRHLSFLRFWVRWLSCHLNSLMVSGKVLEVLFVLVKYFFVSIEWCSFQISPSQVETGSLTMCFWASLLSNVLFLLPEWPLSFPLLDNCLLLHLSDFMFSPAQNTGPLLCRDEAIKFTL